MDIQTVFMGSPDFALPTLRTLHKHTKLVGVVTQPDRRAGRGRQLTPPPVRQLADELGLPAIQPRRLRDPEAMEALHTWSPELIVVAAFGQILRAEVLDLPGFGCINVHASLLPRWRGASPVHHAILHGDAETGVTIMKMDEGLDTGPILKMEAIPILPEDTVASLSDRLAELGADLLIRTLPPYLFGDLSPRPQPEAGMTYAPMLKKQDGELEFGKPAKLLARQVRAFNPWPGSFFNTPRGLLKVHEARPAEGNLAQGERGEKDGLPAVGAADGVLVLEVVQPAGKSPMAGDVFLRGAPDWSTP